jgi:hypothetical protein
MRFFDKKYLAALAAMLVPAAAHDVYACAMCGLPPGDIASHAYNTSVLFMLTAPYAIVAAGAVIGFVAYRNACRRQAAEDQDLNPQTFTNR